jgi:hypothetical protein
MKQRDFVVQALSNASDQGIAGDARIEFAVEQVTQGLLAKECDHSTGFADEKEARKYASAVVRNYLRRAKELNGGVEYKPTNPRGPRDSSKVRELKLALTALKAHGASGDQISIVESAITTQEELDKAEKSKKPTMSADEALAILAKNGVDIAS